MSTFASAARRSRPLWLVLVGMLGGAALLSPASAGRAAVTDTRTVSCAAFNFHPIDRLTVYNYTDHGKLWRSGDGGSGYFLCDPGLPNKAVVTRVRFTVDDPTTEGEVKHCALVRGGLTATTATLVQVLAEVPSTGLAEITHTVRLVSTSITYATIDNAKFAYWLQCQLIEGNVGFHGADVTYTISAANG